MLDTIISNIDSDLAFISENTDNAFALKSVNIINIKMDYIRNKTYSTKETVYALCDKMANFDVRNMRNIPELSEEVYSRIDSLYNEILLIKDAYFEN